MPVLSTLVWDTLHHCNHTVQFYTKYVEKKCETVYISFSVREYAVEYTAEGYQYGNLCEK
jgi:hypothetical protein